MLTINGTYYLSINVLPRKEYSKDVAAMLAEYTAKAVKNYEASLRVARPL